MKLQVFLIAVVLLVQGCGDQGGESPVEDPFQVPLDTLEVALRIGTEYGDSTDAFGAIMDAEILDDGSILVLDRVYADLRLYDPDGEYTRHITRRGSGPGELVMPWDMFMSVDGRLVVMDPGKQGLIVFDDSLEFSEELRLWQQNPAFQSCAVSDSQFAGYKADLDITDTEVLITRRVALYHYGDEDWDMVFWSDTVSLPIDDVRRDRSLLFNNIEEPLVICADRSGSVFFSLKEPDHYSVMKWDASGTELLNITSDIPPVRKSMEEMEAESIYVTNYVNRGGDGSIEWEFQPEPFRNMVTDLGIGPDGNLWVRNGTYDRPVFDIYDTSEGELIGRALFPADGWSWKFEICRNGILAWEEDPEAGFQVLCVLDRSSGPGRD